MTGAGAGYKATFKASSSVGGTKVRVAELQEITWTDKHEPFDATSHDSNGARERIGGMTDMEAGIDGLFRDDDASQVALFDSLTSREKIDVELNPAGTGLDSWSQSGFVSRWSIGGPVDGPAKFSASIVGTGGASVHAGRVTYFLDTFTDANGIKPFEHAPDTVDGSPASTVGWDIGGDGDAVTASWLIQDNEAVGKLGTGQFWVKYGAEIGVHDNFDVFADIHRSSDGNALQVAQIVFRCSSDGAFAARTQHGIMIEHGDNDNVGVRLQTFDGGVNKLNLSLSTAIAWAKGETRRLGATIVGDQLEAWTEPSGGGVRSVVAATTFLAGFVLNSSDNQFIGTEHNRTSTAEFTYDNLTVQDSS